ncbi:MAG: YXWGXW repeat-containing protein, partial [Myxococcales bacterium]|nr:YXWGXW repeat-containing protein [Myxococcales bacterium]
MRRLLIGATIAGALLSWSSCTPYYAQAEWIDPAPPAPRYEEVPPAPFADGFWVSGYWNWTGGTYIWVPGSWQRPPRRGLYWYPGGYVRRDNRYQYVPGRWAPRSYRPTQRYVHPRYY